MSFYLTFFSVGSLMSLLLLASPAQAMSLESAVEETLRRAPTLDAAQARMAQARARMSQANAGLLPSVTLQGGLVWQNEVIFDFGEMVELPEDLPITLDFQEMTVQVGFQKQASLGATWPLLAPQVWEARKLAREGSELADSLADVDRARVASAVIEAWHASARAHALLDESEKTLKVAQGVLETAENMVKNGVAAPDSLLGLRSTLASSKGSVARARALCDAADASLAELTGVESAVADPIKVPSDARSVAEWLAALDRPEIRAARASVDTARQGVASQKSALYPILAATGQVAYLDPVPTLAEDWNWKVLLGATVPIFQGGAVRSRVDEARAKHAEAEANERAIREAAELDVRRAHGNLVGAMASLTENEEAESLARQAVDAAMKRVKEGGGSMFAVEQAQGALAAASLRLTVARCDAAQALDRLRLAVKGGVS